MAATVEIKKKLLENIGSVDEQLLQMRYALERAYQSDENEEVPVVPESLYQMLDDEREMHLNEESVSYTWEEVKKQLENRYN